MRVSSSRDGAGGYAIVLETISGFYATFTAFVLSTHVAATYLSVREQSRTFFLVVL